MKYSHFLIYTTKLLFEILFRLMHIRVIFKYYNPHYAYNNKNNNNKICNFIFYKFINILYQF